MQDESQHNAETAGGEDAPEESKYSHPSVIMVGPICVDASFLRVSIDGKTRSLTGIGERMRNIDVSLSITSNISVAWELRRMRLHVFARHPARSTSATCMRLNARKAGIAAHAATNTIRSTALKATTTQNLSGACLSSTNGTSSVPYPPFQKEGFD
jgi:hypothetical protein